MRAPALAVALLLVLVLLPPGARAAPQDFGAVGYVNKLIDVVSTPQLEPGQTGAFLFQLNSSYPAGMVMLNVRLNVSIYAYATIDQEIPVNASWPYPYPLIRESGARERSWNFPYVAPGNVTNLSFTVVTSSDSSQMPSGSVFNQASYFLRFWLEFDGNVSGTIQHFRMASKGYFSPAVWDRALNATNTNPCTPPECRGNINVAVLGVDGVLADSSFGVLEPIPRWPFYLLIAFAIFFVALAFLFWVEENSGTYPRVETWWARQRGRMTRLRPRRRKKSGPPP